MPPTSPPRFSTFPTPGRLSLATAALVLFLIGNCSAPLELDSFMRRY